MNPEFYTIWNFRREVLCKLFDNGVLSSKVSLEDDLKLVMMLLKRFPKCYWIWNHRKWCLYYLGDEANWEFELSIVSKLLSLDQRNFHGWQYRRFVVENMEPRCKDKAEEFKLNLSEYDYTTSKINNNISNFSAWHNRSKLIPKTYKLSNDNEWYRSSYDILKDELKLVNTGMFVDVEDTSVWLYLYWLLTNKFFINELSPNTYRDILQDQLNKIEELNELEKEDNDSDNAWCIKSLIWIKSLLIKHDNPTINNDDLLTEEIKSKLKSLISIDPLRKGKYTDQLNGISPILYE